MQSLQDQLIAQNLLNTYSLWDYVADSYLPTLQKPMASKGVFQIFLFLSETSPHANRLEKWPSCNSFCKGHFLIVCNADVPIITFKLEFLYPPAFQVPDLPCLRMAENTEILKQFHLILLIVLWSWHWPKNYQCIIINSDWEDIFQKVLIEYEHCKNAPLNKNS